jgi:hypothetical protein
LRFEHHGGEFTRRLRKGKSTKQNYHEDSDSSYESSSSCSEDQPLSPRKKRSDRKKTINSALACASTGWKVSIDDDEDQDDTSSKKKNSVASTLKNEVLTDPGKYMLIPICAQFHYAYGDPHMRTF